MKGNEMLFEIIYIVVLWVWFQCHTGEGVKILRKPLFQENRKSRGDSNNINGKAHAILTLNRSLFFCIV